MSAVTIDASVLYEALSGGALSTWADGVLESATQLVAPQHICVELMSVLRKRMLAGLATRAEVEAVMRDALELDLDLEPFASVAGRVAALMPNVTPYDAWYVAVAELWETPLATVDGRLARASGPRCSFLVPKGVET